MLRNVSIKDILESCIDEYANDGTYDEYVPSKDEIRYKMRNMQLDTVLCGNYKGGITYRWRFFGSC